MSVTSNHITSNHITSNGRPAGGTTYGRGFAIGWQAGPLAENGQRTEANGAFVEDVIVAARDRIEFYESAGFGCEENREALYHLCQALMYLNRRTARREAAGVEGTYGMAPGDDAA